MRNCKRLLSVLLATVMTFVSVPVSAFAEDTDAQANTKPVIYAESKTVSPGETFSVNIGITNNPGILGATLSVSYDEGLTLKEAESGDAFSYLVMTKPGKYSSPCRFSWDGQSIEPGEVVGAGTILTLTFTAADTFTSLTRLNITVTAGDDIYDNNLQQVDVETEGGTVTVID